VVISRLYAVVILVLFSMFSIYYVYVSPSAFQAPAHDHAKPAHEIQAQWTDFIEDCGGETIVENYVHAKKIFEDRYENAIVTWRGYYAETKPTAGLNWFNTDHALNILVKMSPSESSIYPDLVLSISQKLQREKKALFEGIKKGEEIEFKAQMVSLGSEFKMHHLHALEIEKTGGFKGLDEIVVKESALPGY